MKRNRIEEDQVAFREATGSHSMVNRYSEMAVVVYFNEL